MANKQIGIALIAFSAMLGSTEAVRVTREPLLTWQPTGPKSHPINYFVPQFGADDDIVASKKNMADAEAKLGAWDLEKKKDDDPIYTVPNWGYDQEIVDSLSNLKNSESEFGSWNIPMDK